MKDNYLNQNKFQRFLERGEPPLFYGRQLLSGDKNKKRVLAILEGKVVPPYEVEIQPSSSCNLACEHCFGRYYTPLPNKIGNKELEIIANRIDEFQDNGFKIETVKFCGTTGEPLVNPATLHGIELFKNRGKNVMIFTNGLFLDKRTENTGLKYYDFVGSVDKLNLSLDAGSEKTFFDLKGKYGFDRIINSLGEIVKIREKRNKGLDLRVSYVIGEKNYEDVARATKIVKDLGANEIIFRIDFTGTDKAIELFETITDQVRKAKEYKSDSFKVIANYSEDEVLIGSHGINSPDRKCFNNNFWTCIGPDAELYACGHRTYGGVKSFGSLLENSFRDLWIGEERKNAAKNLPDLCCKNCSPSSKIRNEIMNFFSGLTIEESKELIENTDSITMDTEKEERIAS
jgi:MoaA/NifB/PqqE/SkfB family radical SAM enzyme